MSDVTALVLSIGECYTDRAIASIQCQNLPTPEIIVVRGLSPFHRAFNSGASRVRSEFFIQVDADMILDHTCIADLRSSMSNGVGIVVGHLRDPLLSRVVGIKLFRTECFDHLQLRDSISSETDFVQDIEQKGWMMIYALKYTGELSTELHTFGEHRPDYNLHYTFCKFVREGAKARYRKAGGGLRSVFRRLQASAHGAATVATIAAAHGIFVREERDLHGPLARREEFEFLERFLRNPQVGEDPPAVQAHLVRRNLRKAFKRSYELGIRLRQRHAPSAFMTYMRQLGQEGDIASWVALVGLCHGLFISEYRKAEAEEAFALLRELLPA